MRIEQFAAVATVGLACVAAPAAAETADWYRGGWRTDGGDPHIYEFVIDGSKVSGIYCTQCSDGTTLARITGTFDERSGIAFTIRFLNLDGTLAREDRFTAELDHGKLQIAGMADGRRVEQVAIKDPRGPDPSAFPVAILPPDAPPVPRLPLPAGGGGGGGAPPAPYVQPATWRQLSPADVVGVWVGFGFGINKQYFVIRQDGDELFGLACGRCDNPYTMGALENFRFDGDLLTFDIRHQDWGDGNRLPFDRKVAVHIAMNEMRMDARRDDTMDRPGIIASLVGPISLEATRGNVVGE